MVQKLNKEAAKGFTIIEVLIVLAIAGLIMIVVFLAVPALQRNSRNNSRTTDINNLSSAVAEFSSSNSGLLPAAGIGSTGGSADVDAVISNTKLGFYTTASHVAVVQYAAGLSPVSSPDNAIRIVRGAKCGGATAGAVTGGNARQFAIQFAVEGGSDAVPRCQNG